MQKFIELKDYIFSKGNKLKKNPELILYYVTLGTWCDDSNLNASVLVGKENLMRTNLFSKMVDYLKKALIYGHTPITGRTGTPLFLCPHVTH